MKVVISSSHFRRPLYSAITMRALAGQFGIEYCDFVASLDVCDVWQQTAFNVRRFMDGKAKSCHIELRKGRSPSCNGNIRHALEMAYELKPDFIIHVEDDVMLGHDALPWMIHNANGDFFTIGCWEHPNLWGKPEGVTWGRIVMAFPTDWFCAWGWGARAEIVKEMLDGWPDDNAESWDIVVRDKIRRGRPSLHPYVGRSINIGQGGTHRGDNLDHSFINGRITREDVRRMESEIQQG